MFKGFLDTPSNRSQFNGIPNVTFGMNNKVYGFEHAEQWLDANYGTNTRVNGATVTSWRDRISTLIWSNGTVAQQPLYVLSDPNFNNHPSIDCNTVAKVLGSLGFGLKVGQFTLVIVAKKNSNNTGANTILSAGGGGGNGAIQIHPIGIQGISSSLIDDTAAHIIIITPTKLMIDGALAAIYSFTPSMTYSTLGTSTSHQTNGISRYAEIIKYNQALTEDQMLELSDKLNEKYALY